jgi:hypothetical protein
VLPHKDIKDQVEKLKADGKLTDENLNLVRHLVQEQRDKGTLTVAERHRLSLLVLHALGMREDDDFGE